MRKSTLKTLNASLTSQISCQRDECHSRAPLDTDNEVCLIVQCLRQRLQEVARAGVCVVSVSFASCSTSYRRIAIDVAVSQVIQADAVADIEWLDCWLNLSPFEM